MRHLFQFESKHTTAVQSDLAAPSDLAAQLEVEISIQCRDADGADAEFVIESIEDVERKVFLEFEQLHPEDQARLESVAQAYADEHGYDAYREYCEGEADRLYDQMKDDQMFEGMEDT